MGKKINNIGIGSLFLYLVSSYNLAFSQPDTVSIKPIITEKIKTISGKNISPSDLKTFLLDEMAKTGIPGLSISIINDKQVIFCQNLGVKNFQTMEWVDSSSLFEACSLSKPIFSYFTLLLGHRGALDLDIPIFKAYMDPEVDYSDNFYKELTVRKILNHSSGWVNWREKAKEKLKFKFLPGTRSGYSGEGYQFITRFLKYRLDASDSLLNEYFHQLIVEPLHCSPMDFVWNSSENNLKVFGHVSGKPEKRRQINTYSQFDAAGGLLTNAMAFSKFIIALMDTRDPIVNELLTLQTTLPSENDGLFRSLGFPYKNIDKKVRFFHSGSNIGSRSYCHFYRKEKIGIVMFANSDNFFSSGFAKKVLEYLGEPYPY